jgi:hypothetical protein
MVERRHQASRRPAVQPMFALRSAGRVNRRVSLLIAAPAQNGAEGAL